MNWVSAILQIWSVRCWDLTYLYIKSEAYGKFRNSVCAKKVFMGTSFEGSQWRVGTHLTGLLLKGRILVIQAWNDPVWRPLIDSDEKQPRATSGAICAVAPG